MREVSAVNSQLFQTLHRSSTVSTINSLLTTRRMEKLEHDGRGLAAVHACEVSAVSIASSTINRVDYQKLVDYSPDGKNEA